MLTLFSDRNDHLGPFGRKGKGESIFVSTQYLLGIRPTLKGLVIDPCIPAEWNGFTVERTYRGCRLHIRVENGGVEHGVKALYPDGKSWRAASFCPNFSRGSDGRKCLP